MEATECGAAALGIVLGYYGHFAGLEELRLVCGVSRDGSNAANIAKAARNYGMIVKAASVEPAILRTLLCPMIVFWEFNHFLVVEGFSRGKVYLNDPASGPRVVSDEEFNSSFTGVVLVLQPGPDFKHTGAKHTLVRAMVARLKGSGGAVTFVALASLFLVIPGLLIPAFGRVFVDSVLKEGMRGWVRPLLIGMAITAVTRGLLTWLQQRYLARLETKLAMTESARFFWRLLRLPASFFSQRHPGELGSRVGANDRVAELLSQELATKMFNVAVVIFFAAILFSYDTVLALLATLSAGLNVLALWYVSRRRLDANRKLLKDREKIVGIAMSGLQSIDSLKATGCESEFFRRFAGHQARWLNAEQAAGLYTSMLSSVPPLLASFGSTAVLALGGLRVMDGRMTIGMLVAFQSLMGYFLSPIADLVNAGAAMQEAEGYLSRLDDVLQFGNSRSQPDGIPTVPGHTPAANDGEFTRQLSGRLDLVDVTFKYNPVSAPLIQNFALSLHPGDRVALVGATGSGKSTVARLVMGLYPPSGGQVLLDGESRERISTSVITESLGMVDQDVVLFAGTVRENLTLWDSCITHKELLQAAKDACIHEEIMRRVGGYDGPVSEGGANFSAGQRQRLEIARALARRPSLLVLDEATSALDAVTEAIIDRNLRRRGCTCLIVAHRLSTVRDAQEILVLNKGTVVQRGSHAQLSQQDGPYARLLASEASEENELIGFDSQGNENTPEKAHDAAVVIPEQRDEPTLQLVPTPLRPSTSTARAAADRELHHALRGLAAVTHSSARRPILVNPADPLLAAYRMVIDSPAQIASPPAGMPVTQRVEALANGSSHRYRSVKLTSNWWRNDNGPLLGFREGDLPVALLPVSPRRYDLIDPVDGSRQRITAQLAREITPNAFSMTRPLPASITRKRDPILFALANCGRDIATVLLTAIATGLLALTLPLATGAVVDSYIPEARRGQLLFLAAGLIIAAIVTTVFRLVGGIAALRMEVRMNSATIAATWDRLLRLPAPFFRSFSAGDLAMRAMGTAQVNSAVVSVVASVSFVLVPAIFNLGLLFYLDWRIAFLSVLVLVLVSIVIAGVCYFDWKYCSAILALEGTLAGRVLETLTGINKIKAAGAETRFFNRWANQFAMQKSAAFRAHRVSTFMAVFGSTFPPLATIAIFAMFARSDAPYASLGTFIAFNTAFGMVLGAAFSLGSTARGIVRMLPVAKRAMPILLALPEGGEPAGELTGEIKLEQVSFRYEPGGPLVLDKVDLQIHRGEFLAIVGRSGSGKSTLLRMLLGLDRPDTGSVSYDRRDLKTLDVSGVRRQIGSVVQNGRLLAGSILQNIAGSLSISHDDAMKLASRVGLDDCIRSMPMGLHTYVNDGASTLSGGQRLQLMLARALAGNPKILLFDEATSALDNNAQALVSRGLKQLPVTRIVIAHRLSTIRAADRIIVIDAGRIVQTGRYQDLAGTPGPFADLIARQLA